jgi:N-glycosylase/DNA lyase
MNRAIKGGTMIFKGLKIIEKKNRVIIEGVRDFDPVHIFECGQCFRWLKEMDGSYTGVVKGKVVNVSFVLGKLIIG